MKLTNQNISFNKSEYMTKKLQSRLAVANPIGAQPIKDPQNGVSFKGAESLFFKFAEYGDYKKLLKIAARDIDNVGEDLLEDLRKRGAHAENKFINKVDTDTTIKIGEVIKNVESKITFKEDKFLQSLKDSVIFPVKEVPFLVTDFVLNIFKKVPGLKKPADTLFESKFFKGRREASAMKEDVHKVKGLIDKTDKLVKEYIAEHPGATIDDIINMKENPTSISDGLFKSANKFFDPETGNYNTVHERSLNRIVSGLIPAAFLANDAYNLSVLCKDDKKTSLKEKDARFKQEVSRVMTNAYIQLITLGALGKFVNNSPVFSAGVSAATVLVAETFSRLLNGKPINFISSEKAKELNKKEALKNEKKNNPKETSSITQLDKPAGSNDTKAAPAKLNFGESQIQTKNVSDTKNKKEQKTLITFSTLKKAVGIIVGGGIALSYLRNRTKPNDIKWKNSIDEAFKSVSKFWKNNIYNKLAKKDFEISVKDFDKVIKRLEAAGQKNLALKYKDIIDKAQIVNIGGEDFHKFEIVEKESVDKAAKGAKEKAKKYMQVDSKFKPYVDIVIEPFKFAWAAVKLPYKIVKNLLNIPAGSIRVNEKKFKDAEKIINNKEFASEEDIIKANKNIAKKITETDEKIVEFTEKFFGKPSEKESKSTQQIFAASIEKILQKNKGKGSKKLSEEEFNKFINSSVISSFNSTTKSDYSNADLGMITKIASSAVTSGFLVADNYNMVMVKSNGEDKADAKQKAQERIVQRVSALFYQTMFMKWFNSTFCNTYHSSLSGMSGVVGVNTVVTEVFTRKSIGMPLGAKSYDQLAEIDNKNLNRKDFLGSYFRFMSQLTGKKPLAKKQSAQEVETQNAKKVDAFALLNNKQNKKFATTDLLAIYGSKNK